jgi:hypothetical protein
MPTPPTPRLELSQDAVGEVHVALDVRLERPVGPPGFALTRSRPSDSMSRFLKVQDLVDAQARGGRDQGDQVSRGKASSSKPRAGRGRSPSPVRWRVVRSTGCAGAHDRGARPRSASAAQRRATFKARSSTLLECPPSPAAWRGLMESSIRAPSGTGPSPLPSSRWRRAPTGATLPYRGARAVPRVHRGKPGGKRSKSGANYWSRRPESNRRPADYESAALPSELRRRNSNISKHLSPVSPLDLGRVDQPRTSRKQGDATRAAHHSATGRVSTPLPDPGPADAPGGNRRRVKPPRAPPARADAAAARRTATADAPAAASPRSRRRSPPRDADSRTDRRGGAR